MAFICICMSPAIDASIALDRAPKGDGEIFKNVKSTENVGGKAINVARWLALRGLQAGTSVTCAGLLGADNAEIFVREFGRYGIADRMTRVPGATRRNEMITWPGGSFKLNQSAFPGVAFDEKAFFYGMERLGAVDAGERTVVVLSGSLPVCCGVGFYARAVAWFRARGNFVVLDASGEPMRLALEAHPDLIKPNAEECEELVGFVPVTADDFRRATEMLRRQSSHVIISAGADGAWFDGEFTAAPRVVPVDTTSAGDTLLAEYCWQRFGTGPNGEPGGVARFAVAAGSAAVELPGSNPPAVERVAQLCRNIG